MYQPWALIPTSPGPHAALMLTSPGPHVTLMLTRPEPYMIDRGAYTRHTSLLRCALSVRHRSCPWAAARWTRLTHLALCSERSRHRRP